MAALWPLLAAAAWLAPTVVDLWRGPWTDPLHSHGPLLLAVAAVLAWRAWPRAGTTPTRTERGVGAALVLVALLLATLGRWGDAPLLQAAALSPALAGAALVSGGRARLRALAFPVGFLLFVIPLPAALADALTQPLKLGVSAAAAALLRAAGQPVWLDGVVLGLGPYRLLVADACAGLGSLLMLEAFGLLYLHLVRHASARRTAVLALMIVPISLAANVVRVLVLALVTLHLGDAAGQGVVHGASGVILFVAALALIGPLDLLLRRLWPAAPVVSAPPATVAGRRSVVLALLFGTGAVVHAAGPRPALTAAGLPQALQDLVPRHFGGWHELAPTAQAQVAAATGAADIYDELLVRSYRHDDGRHAMLTLAYARAQRRAVRVHEPPACYAAAGFRVQHGATVRLAAARARSLLARRDGRVEAVLWWVRLGARADTPGALATGAFLFRQRLAGRVPDGLLVRASALVAAQAGADVGSIYAVPQALLSDLLAALRPAQRQALTGAA